MMILKSLRPNMPYALSQGHENVLPYNVASKNLGAKKGYVIDLIFIVKIYIIQLSFKFVYTF